MSMTIKKTELQKAIESFIAKKQKIQQEQAGITECRDALSSITEKTEYMNMQILAYNQSLDTMASQVTELDEVITKLS